MITNRFQGDPKLILGPDGSSLVYKGGQPVMDQGIENAIMIPLFTKKKGKSINQKGWWMNLLWSNPVNQSGSDYVDTVINQPLTLNGLANIEKAAAKALTNPLFGNVTSEVTNPEANRIDNKITVSSPGKDVDFLAVSENAENWRAQALGQEPGEISKAGVHGDIFKWVPLKTKDGKFLKTKADERILVKIPG